MDRTTVYLDPELKRKLRETAARLRKSEALLIREALSRYLAGCPTVDLKPVGRSEDGGIADRDEEVLRRLGFGHRGES